MRVLYQCETCGRTSENKSDIEKCETKGIPKPLVNIGDTIYFKDCEETPVLFGEGKDPFSKLYSDDIIGVTMREACTCLNQLCEYKVINIIIEGHNVEYILGSSEKYHSYDACVGGYHWHYPKIYGNKLMKKILNKYNKKEKNNE